MASKTRFPVWVVRVYFACPQHVWLGDVFGTRVIGFAGSSALSALFWLGPGLLKFCVHVACRANHLLRSKAVQPPAEKFALAPSGKSPLRLPAILSHQEGRLAIATNAGQGAVDAGPVARRARRRADGEAVWS
jgi:hypothetical protein